VAAGIPALFHISLKYFSGEKTKSTFCDNKDSSLSLYLSVAFLSIFSSKNLVQGLFLILENTPAIFFSRPKATSKSYEVLDMQATFLGFLVILTLSPTISSIVILLVSDLGGGATYW